MATSLVTAFQLSIRGSGIGNGGDPFIEITRRASRELELASSLRWLGPRKAICGDYRISRDGITQRQRNAGTIPVFAAVGREAPDEEDGEDEKSSQDKVRSGIRTKAAVRNWVVRKNGNKGTWRLRIIHQVEYSVDCQIEWNIGEMQIQILKCSLLRNTIRIMYGVLFVNVSVWGLTRGREFGFAGDLRIISPTNGTNDSERCERRQIWRERSRATHSK